MSHHNSKDEDVAATRESETHALHARAATASPRVVTTGGNKEPSRITGPESPSNFERVELVSNGNGGVYIRSLPDESVAEDVAHLDWLAFTVTPPEGQTPVWLFNALRQFLPIQNFTHTGKGWNGYKERHTIIGLGEAELGLLALGGESQRGSLHVELNAQACALINVWPALQAWGEQYKANITRVDLAHDDLTGDTASINTALAWLEAGLFNLNGRPAKARLIDDLGSGDGKTLYVGKRANGKMLRIYEKGKQLGDSQSPWVRVEAELRNKSRVIPWGALTRPGNYLAGAYPCLAYLSGKQDKIKTITKAVEISLESSVEHLHQTGGKLINLLMHVHCGDAFAVVDELKRPGIPQRLKAYAHYLHATESPGQPS
jgi:DNA relaxase NicK